MDSVENERNDSYDSACRDQIDNCPTEGAVLKREWRQKAATIAILSSALERQGSQLSRLRSAVLALLDDLGRPDDGAEANLIMAVREAMADDA